MPEDETSPRPSIWTPEVTLVPRGEVLYLKVMMMMVMMMVMTMMMVMVMMKMMVMMMTTIIMMVVMMVTLVPRGSREVLYPKVSTKGVQL